MLRKPGRSFQIFKVIVILTALFSIWLMVSLLSFNPLDPSWSQIGWSETIHNFGGIPGAWIADMFFFIFGIAAYEIPAIIINGCWFAWYHQQNLNYIDYFWISLRLIGALVLILTSCSFLAINVDDIWYYFVSGGVIGSLLSNILLLFLSRNSSNILLLCIWAAGLSLFTSLSWIKIGKRSIGLPSVF